jgi:hypothetical protein
MAKPKAPHWCVLVFIEVVANLCLCVCRIVHAVPLIIDTSNIEEAPEQPVTPLPPPPIKEEVDPDWIQII